MAMVMMIFVTSNIEGCHTVNICGLLPSVIAQSGRVEQPLVFIIRV